MSKNLNKALQAWDLAMLAQEQMSPRMAKDAIALADEVGADETSSEAAIDLAERACDEAQVLANFTVVKD